MHGAEVQGGKHYRKCASNTNISSSEPGSLPHHSHFIVHLVQMKTAHGQNHVFPALERKVKCMW
ncbi:hypothetical protein SESBI_26605 [Sesbania bispinosa]|nr:hypothetical protein SESBI_26605 [Sesbania bispinosa]